MQIKRLNRTKKPPWLCKELRELTGRTRNSYRTEKFRNSGRLARSLLSLEGRQEGNKNQQMKS